MEELFVVGLPEREYQRALAQGEDLSPRARQMLVARPTRRIGDAIREVAGSETELRALRRWFEHAGCVASVAAIDLALE